MPAARLMPAALCALLFAPAVVGQTKPTVVLVHGAFQDGPTTWGRVPKFYVLTTKDQCVSPAIQERMAAATTVVRVTKIEAGHASYVTQPAAVAAAIAAAVK